MRAHDTSAPQHSPSTEPGSVVIRAPAKLNLFLEILGKRSDGYHELETLMVAVDRFDTLELKEEPGHSIHLTCDDPRLPSGHENLVWRAAELLQRSAGLKRGAAIHLSKRIPAAAGLGGGSSDAAAALIGLNRLWSLGLSNEQLSRLGAGLGSDVPFFFALPAAWCTGRGERVTPVALRQQLHFVIACPGVELSTAEVYRCVVVPSEPRNASEMKRAFEAGDIEAIGAQLHNRLQSAAEERCPQVVALRELFASHPPAGHLMSGSGSSYFALCRDEAEAQRFASIVANELGSRQSPEAGNKPEVFVARSVSGEREPNRRQRRSQRR